MESPKEWDVLKKVNIIMCVKLAFLCIFYLSCVFVLYVFFFVLLFILSLFLILTGNNDFD